MKNKKIIVKYEDVEPEVVAFRLEFEELPKDNHKSDKPNGK